MKVDIILLNYNNLKFTKMCIATLYHFTKHPFNLIIVDNASTEKQTKEYFRYLEKKHKNVIVHYNEVPDSGFAEGNNIGLQYAEHELICLLNNDILIPSKNWLKHLVVHLNKEDVALVGCKLVYPNDTIQFAGGFLMPQAFTTLNCFYHRGRFETKDKFSTIEYVPQITFAFVIAKREIFGRLDERYKIGTFEDNDKCMELLKKGYKLLYDGNVFLYHYETATQFKRDPKMWSQNQWKNSMMFRERWIPYIFWKVREDPYFWGWNKNMIDETIETLEKTNKVPITDSKVLSYEEFIKLVNQYG